MTPSRERASGGISAGSVHLPRSGHTWRPYSVACAPRPDGALEFHVRSTGPGGVSEALVARTRVGDPLRRGPALGEFEAPAQVRDGVEEAVHPVRHVEPKP
ncbi:FAD-binding oxidoreductase [Streptomyces sp. MNU76]|uniref:FAD-binding oxidoreductase n=1 Tax=Streptomyces sp. MNU76 TaxID=2560026 RepID=UPI0035A907E3